MLLLHGSGPGVSGWANFRGNLPAFAARYRTLVLDMPGFGKSYSCEGSPVMAAPGAVVDFLDGMGLGALPIVGNSMGGNVAARIAANHPDRVSRLVTIGGVGVPIFSPGPAEGVKLLVEFVEDPTRERLVAWMESMVFDPDILTDEFVELRWEAANAPGALDDVRRMFNRKMLTGMRKFAAAAAADQVGMLAKIEAPTLITFGRDDRVTPARQRARADAHRPPLRGPHLPELRALGDDRAQGRVRERRAVVPRPRRSGVTVQP